MCFLATVGLSGTASAALDIQAKAVKTTSNQEEEILSIRIDLKNTGSTPLGPLVVQYRYSGFSEFDSEGKPEGPLKQTENSLKETVQLAPGQKASVDSPDPLPAGATVARLFLLAGSRLTLSATAPVIATTALLEKVP